MNIVNMSFSAAIFILVVITARLLLMKLLPKSTFIVLWGMALIQLVIPYKIPYKFSIYSIIQNMIGDSSTTVMPSTIFWKTNFGADSSTNLINNIHTSLDLPYLLLISWAIGFTCLSCYFIISFIKINKMLKESLPLQKDNFIHSWIKEHKMGRTTIALRTCDTIATPMAYGLLRPSIILPKHMDLSNQQQLEYILMHEMVHIKRHDNIWKLISIFALCIHWFNPIVWIMFHLLKRDLEIACDEKVITMCGVNTKSTYAMTLIQMAQQNQGISPLASAFGKTAIEERIYCIMKIKKTSLLCSALALTLVAGIGATFSTSVQASNEMDTVKLQSVVALPASATTDSIKAVSIEDTLKPYEEFGLIYNKDTNTVTYKDETVSVFFDETTGLGFTFTGDINVVAVYENGILTSLKKTDKSDFATGDLSTIISFKPSIDSTKDGSKAIAITPAVKVK